MLSTVEGRSAAAQQFKNQHLTLATECCGGHAHTMVNQTLIIAFPLAQNYSWNGLFCVSHLWRLHCWKQHVIGCSASECIRRLIASIWTSHLSHSLAHITKHCGVQGDAGNQVSAYNDSGITTISKTHNHFPDTLIWPLIRRHYRDQK